jgi:hypothetical protein
MRASCHGDASEDTTRDGGTTICGFLQAISLPIEASGPASSAVIRPGTRRFARIIAPDVGPRNPDMTASTGAAVVRERRWDGLRSGQQPVRRRRRLRPS